MAANRLMESRGHPRAVTAAGKAYDEDAGRLWDISEQLTGVHYEFAAMATSAAERKGISGTVRG